MINKKAKNIVDELLKIVSLEENIVRVDIFGSCIRENTNPNDIDIVVVMRDGCGRCSNYEECMGEDISDEFQSYVDERCQLGYFALLEAARDLYTDHKSSIPLDIKITNSDNYNPEKGLYPDAVESITRHGRSLFTYCGDNFFVGAKKIY